MSKTPKKEEQQVIDSLILQGYTDYEYEPEKNCPPDILINGEIAIEVRRLNQNLVVDEKLRGLEQDDNTIDGLLRKAIKKVSDDNHEKSAFVDYRFIRPLPDMNEIRRNLTQILKKHKSFIHEKREYNISDNFTLIVYPSTEKLQNQYQYGKGGDEGSSGIAVQLTYDNLELIIKEKEGKTRDFKHKYKEWWLAVVDTIGYELTDLDIEHLYRLPQLECSFNRIMIVSPEDASTFRYLYEK